MNLQKISGLAGVIMGLAMMGYALHGMGKLSAINNDIHGMENPFTQNPLGKRISQSIQSKIGRTESEAKWLFVCGMIVMLAGGATLYFYRKKN